MMTNKNQSNIVPFNSIEEAARLNLEIARESLRQAKESFTLAHRTFQLSILMSATSALISLTGVILLILGHPQQGITTTAGGLTSSVIFSQRIKEAQAQVQKANDRLDNIRLQLWDNEMSAIFYPIIHSFSSEGSL
ncbi:MAG: hypothetical protein ABG776_01925 [Cyanobacteria bacterium J06555_13]